MGVLSDESCAGMAETENTDGSLPTRHVETELRPFNMAEKRHLKL